MLVYLLITSKSSSPVLSGWSTRGSEEETTKEREKHSRGVCVSRAGLRMREKESNGNEGSPVLSRWLFEFNGHEEE